MNPFTFDADSVMLAHSSLRLPFADRGNKKAVSLSSGLTAL